MTGPMPDREGIQFAAEEAREWQQEALADVEPSRVRIAELALERMARLESDAWCEGAPGEGLAPPRGRLLPEVESAARLIHRDVWGSPYREGQGAMHHAGGGYWRAELLRRAMRWEEMAEAARVCARELPDA